MHLIAGVMPFRKFLFLRKTLAAIIFLEAPAPGDPHYVFSTIP
jgi:hypothetical protein